MFDTPYFSAYNCSAETGAIICLQLRIFLRVSNQMRDYYAKKIKDSFQEFNFSPNEISILIVLKNNSTITTSTELKVVLGVSKTLISRSVDSLEKKGLICTCIDEKDSRIHHLQLTDECKPILKIIDEEIGKINKTLFNDVSVEEMKSLKQTMSKLQKRVEEGK
jgi:DNA-binding MarR family transcriptional regulator